MEIRKMESVAEARDCAGIMASSEPWITLRRGFSESLKLIVDQEKEVFVALDNQITIGFIVLNMKGPFIGYIQTVAVHKDWRSRGVGSKLIAFAENYIFNRSPNVFMCVSSFNVKAMELYTRLGFKKVGELKDYIIPGHSEILMRKTIAPKSGFQGHKDRPHGAIRSSILEVVGNTPVVDLSRITKYEGGHILAKLEYLNPGLSKKDRPALQIIEDAEREGSLKPGQYIVELTSGNMGTGLAIACAIKGYRFVAVMSRGNSPERARMMVSLGAEVVLVNQLPDSIPGQVSGGDLELVEQETQRIVRERGAFRADQFKLQGNFRSHFNHTGPEFLRQTEGMIDAFCDFPGSGGTFAGCAASFKEYDPSIRCFIVEPDGAAVLGGEKVTHTRHRIQGGGYSMPRLSFIKPEYIDGFLKVTDEEAIDAARRLAREEGIFAGFSSGANVAAALKLLRGSCPGMTVACIINDSGLKYLSTDLWL
jgi:cysteine synthase A